MTLQIRRPEKRRRPEPLAPIVKTLEKSFGRVPPPRKRSEALGELIETVLSQHTTDRNSSAAWRSLRSRYPDWDDVVRAGPKRVARAIRMGGLPNQKSRAIISILRELRQRFGAYTLKPLAALPTPQATEFLMSLHGVGPKTAAVTLAFGFGRDVFPVDTHIHRVANRLGVVVTKNPEQTYSALEGRIPRGRSFSFHLHLLELGKRLCRPRAPRCPECPLLGLCQYGSAQTP